MPETVSNSLTMRELMPEGYLSILCKRTGTTNPSNMAQVVGLENTKNKYWPAVEQLARETNPEGFAQWQAAKAGAVAA